MSLKGVFLFSALLWATCDSFSLFQSCYKTYKMPDLSKLDAKSRVEDIKSFSKNFDERYKELEKFIENNLSQSSDADVQFDLYTQNDWEKPEHLDQSSLNKTHFNHEYPVQVLVHGLQPLGSKDEGTDALKHALLYKGQQNVIVMRYQKVSEMPYTEAVKNSYLVAKNAADFLNHLLKTFKITADKLHLIGFEFGGQLVGNIGHHIPGLARVTALDPAGALFDQFDAKHRISDDDAVFVDIIHTSTDRFPRGLGMAESVGHQDFYPNGGKKQPGCPHNITADQAGGREAAEFKNAVCDNVRALEYFTESVCDRLCVFRGRACNDYDSYQRFHCLPFIKSTKDMGFYAMKDPNVEKHLKYFLDTNSKYPYCKYF